MYMFVNEVLTFTHIRNEETTHKIESNPVLMQIYASLVAGVNVTKLSCYNEIAEYLITLTDDQAKAITYDDVFENVGHYIDETDYLV